VNEEHPFFQTPLMGSWVYARRCRERGEQVAAMISLETLGCYADAPGTQRYPFPFGLFLPSTGNYIALLSNLRSHRMARTVLAVTDTAWLRYRHYHMPEDTPDKLDCARMATVVNAVGETVRDLACGNRAV
jgi:hypothetical protein